MLSLKEQVTAGETGANSTKHLPWKALNKMSVLCSLLAGLARIVSGECTPAADLDDAELL